MRFAILNDPSPIGYLLYLSWILLPGIGFSELLGIWNKESGIVERVGVSVGIGLAVDTLAILVKTSGLTVSGLRLSGIDTGTVYLITASGILALIASYMTKRKLIFTVRPSGSDLFILFLTLLQGLIIYLYFQKYPIFPAYQSADFANHVQFAEGLISGSFPSIPRGILYFGVHFQLASAILLAGGEPLVTVQRAMAILVLLSPSIVYLCSKKVSASRGAALVVTSIYSLSSTIWFVSVFNSGLYANFFGILASLFLLVVLVDLFEKQDTLGKWIAFILVLFTAYFSHYTAITLLPALLAVPVAHYLKSRSDLKRYLLPPLVAIAPGMLALATFPSLASLLIRLAEEGGGNLIGSTAISESLSGIPVLSYMALEVFDDVAFLFLLIYAAIYIYRVARLKVPMMLIPIFWFISLILASPLNISAWRFSFEALVPLTLMAGFGLYSILPKLRPPRRRGESRAWQYAKIGIVLLILLTPILAYSWTQTAVSDSLTNTSISAKAQHDVYAAIYWLKDNTPMNSRYLSVSDWRFTYTSLFFGRATDYAFFSQPDDAIDFAKKNGYSYIIVTNLVTESLPPIPSLFPWNNFKPSSNLTLVYSNQDVKIFKIV